MDVPPSSAIPPRRRWLRMLLAFFVGSLLLIGLAAFSFVSLPSGAAALRKEVMAASGTEWNTQVQINLGRCTIWALRAGLRFAPQKEIAEARDALAALKTVSVGVYRSRDGRATPTTTKLLGDTDRLMRARGWTRLVGVSSERENVLIYVPSNTDELREVCLAVVKPRELVVVSATVDADSLVALAGRQLPKLPVSML